VRALDEWAAADPNRMTREEALADGRRLGGPPYRMTIEFPLPPLTKEEEADALAQAEYEDDTGIERDPETYTVLRAQNAKDAKREAEDRWRPGRPMTRSATIFGEPIGLVHIRCAEAGLHRSAELDFTAESDDRCALSHLLDG
jgi:hypothetical protein